MINIQFSKDYILNENELLHLQSIVNEAYSNSEKDFWKEGYERVSIKELELYIQNKKVVLAYIENVIVGCLKIDAVGLNKSSFSMISVSENYRNIGVANGLMTYAQKYCKNKNDDFIQLEILLPKFFKHKDKENLKMWYSKLGYFKIKEADFKDYFPDLVSTLKIECTFEVWEKELIK